MAALTEPPSPQEPASGVIDRLITKASFSRKLAYTLAAAAVISGGTTVAIVSGGAPSGKDLQKLVTLLYIDGLLLLLLGAVITHRLVSVWSERKQGKAGSGLHIRLVALFSLVAITPAILVAIFSTLFLNYGIQVWFSERVNTALNESVGVAQAYLLENRKTIHADAFAIANDLNLNAAQLTRNKWNFEQKLTTHSALRSLADAVVIDSNSNVIARSKFSLILDHPIIPDGAFVQASAGQISVIGSETDLRIKALVKLNRFVDSYLLIERFVDSRITNHIERVQTAVDEYNAMEKSRGGIQVSFVLIFAVVTLLLLLAAVWIGLTVSTQLATPVSNLITAAEQVSEGDLAVRVDDSDVADEIGSLILAFNVMTAQLESQQSGLVEANRELDERRRFTETVLAGVSAGVIGLDAEGRIYLPNRSASQLINNELDQQIGEYLGNIIPEMSDLLREAMQRPDRLQQAEVKLLRKDNSLTLLVRIVGERLAGEIIGYVVTFDDVTQLLSAQRKAAWADVARRIAHEIKNPLTPIQLSAERLQRKYSKHIIEDKEVFENCTSTIIRQVEDIGRMVDEFSNFARMPQPEFNRENISEICRNSVFLERNRSQGLLIEVNLPDNDISLLCDARQITRAVTNLLKNASESISSVSSSQTDGLYQGQISLTLAERDANQNETTVILKIEDNGIGLPEDERDRLAEPYVTTRTKGTGLGLAIVKKIMEDHNGELILQNREDGGEGASVSLLFNHIDENDVTIHEKKETDPMKVMASLTVDNA